MITLILRSIIIYCIVLLSVRLMGKRQIGDLQPFELVATLIIADLACVPMSDSSVPIMFGIVPLFTLVILHHFFTVLNRKSITIRKLLNGRPVIVIDEMGINYKALKKLNMTLNDLTEGLRASQCFNLNDVAFAIVETNGNISVLLKSQSMPANNKDLKIKTDNSCLQTILVNDGKIVNDNIKLLNIDENFVFSILKEEKIKNIDDVLIIALNKESGELYIQEKNKKYKIISKEGAQNWKDCLQF